MLHKELHLVAIRSETMLMHMFVDLPCIMVVIVFPATVQRNGSGNSYK